MNKTELIKSHNHNHFWIEDNILYESYKTIRGMRYRQVAEVIMDDIGYLDDDDIAEVNKILKANV